MTDSQVANRLPIYGMIGLTAVIGVINLIQGWEPLRLTIALYDDVDFPLVYITDVVFTIGIGVLMLVAAAMIFRYRKRGLQVGLVAHILFLGNELYWLVRGGQPAAVVWLQMLLSIVAIFFIFRYLTHDPERLLFN